MRVKTKHMVSSRLNLVVERTPFSQRNAQHGIAAIGSMPPRGPLGGGLDQHCQRWRDGRWGLSQSIHHDTLKPGREVLKQKRNSLRLQMAPLAQILQARQQIGPLQWKQRGELRKQAGRGLQRPGFLDSPMPTSVNLIRRERRMLLSELLQLGSQIRKI